MSMVKKQKNPIKDETNPLKFKNIRVMLAGSKAVESKETAAVLEDMGIACDTTYLGENALEMIGDAYDKGAGYDICILDWSLSDLSGIEITRQIRQLFDEPIWIVITADCLTKAAQVQAMAAGADMILKRPVLQKALFDLLLEIDNGKYHMAKKTLRPYDFTGKRVLLAEDTAFSAEVAIELLDMVHMKVTHVENGKRAVEEFCVRPEGTYDAILMDVQMPLMDGYEAARQIRSAESPEGKRIPIFAMTANNLPKDIEEALAAGMNGHIAKPIDVEILYRTLYEACMK